MRRRPLPPYLKIWTDKRNGKRYNSFRKRGHKTVPLPPLGTDEFWPAYNAALKSKLEIGADRSISGSVTAAIAAYYSSHEWRALADGTQLMRRAILEKFRNKYGEWPLQQLNENFLVAYLESLKPHAARNCLKALRGLLVHAKHDVTRFIATPKAKSIKHPSWPAEAMAQYEAVHAVGTNARLAYAIARYTGAGRSEIARMGPPHIVDGEIVITRQKTGVTATIPLLPQLRAVIEATPTVGLRTFLVTKSGKPYTPTDLSDEFRAWCDHAGIPKEFTIHGLRHALGDALAEAGCSPSEIGAILGHASAKTALHYAQGADRKRLSRAAMAKLISSGNGN